MSRVREIIAQLEAKEAAAASRRPVDMQELTGRSEKRLPRQLQSLMTPERLMELYADPWVNPDSGGLFGQQAIETYVATSPEIKEMLRLSPAQLYRTGIYKSRWVRRIGDLVALNIGSLNHWLEQHHEQARAAHIKVLGGVSVGGGSNVWISAEPVGTGPPKGHTAV